MFRKKKKRNDKKEKKEVKERKEIIPENIKKIIIGSLLLLLSLIVLFGFFDIAGKGGEISKYLFEFLLGENIAIIVPFLIFLSGMVYIRTEYENFLFPLCVSILMIISGISGVVSSVAEHTDILGEELKNGNLGGWWGSITSSPLINIIGFPATVIIFLALIFIGSLIITTLLNRDFSILAFLKELFTRGEDVEISTVKKIFSSPEREEKREAKREEKREEEEKKKEKEEKKEGAGIKSKGDVKRLIPPLDLLYNGDENPDPGDVKRNANVIKKTFGDFDISVSMGEVNVGPAVTQYTLKPAEGVKLSRITSLSDDLALSLAMHPVRTEAPIPGKSLVGIEVPNRKRAKITLGSLVKRKEHLSGLPLSFAVGKDVSGSCVYSDLAKMPHMLVAGSTGSGKTIFLNTFLLSLIYKNSPNELRLILVDPKRVEFSFYANIPHLLTPVIFDAEKTSNALSWLIGEMERRFKVLSEIGSRNILSYQETCKTNKELEPMPYIILIVDELADLMATKGNEIEGGIVRVAQMARAVGIHLVLATQRPSVEVITGLIKANITARASFRVASQVDSRTILDMAGAEKLLGSGDMLFLSTENAKPRRIQAPYISEKEAKSIISWLVENKSIADEDPLAENLEEVLEKSSQKDDNFDTNEDEDVLYEDAKEVVISAKKASASLLQRRLRVGYARAARLLDILENRGVIGPAEGAKPRDVYGERVEEYEEEIDEDEKEETGEDKKNEGSSWEEV